jgi:prepilin-type N-terminal cleavage/methylation domain-containing protein
MKQRAKRQGGFTLLEVLLALGVLVIGMAGILGMALGGSKAASYARDANAATVVAEDKLESLRVMTPANLANGTDQVDEHAVVSASGMFTRAWSVTWSGTLATLIVTVTWQEDGSPHTITFRTMRSTS